MAKTVLQQITTRAKAIRKANPAIKWTDAIKKASAELKRTPVKKRAVSGTKSPKKAAKPAKVVVRAKKATVIAGIGCTSRAAMAQMNAVMSGIEKQEKVIKQLAGKVKEVPAKDKPMYRREMSNAKAMLAGLKKAKSAYKKLV